jgi:acyl-CoA thioesterase-1
MRKVWLIAAAVAMCGCRQPSGTGEPERKPPAAEAARTREPVAARDSRPVIECFGDSLTAGFGLDPGHSYPDMLQQELDHAGYSYRVVNLGASGETSQDGLARMNMALAEKPQIVVLEFGANDGLRGVPVGVTEENLARMIRQFQAAEVKVVLAGMTLPPNYGPQFIRRFEAIYTSLASQYRVTLIPFLLEGVGGNPRLMQQDGLHPNADGTRRVAATVFRAVRPLLVGR